MSEELDLPMMTDENTSTFGTAFTVSIEAKKGVTTGISAADRAKTILTAIDAETQSRTTFQGPAMSSLSGQDRAVCCRGPGRQRDLLIWQDSRDLNPAGVICEIMSDDGTMARVPELMEFAKKHNLKIVTVKDIIKYRMRTELFVKRLATVKLPTTYGGDFNAIAYASDIDNIVHIALGERSNKAGGRGPCKGPFPVSDRRCLCFGKM